MTHLSLSRKTMAQEPNLFGDSQERPKPQLIRARFEVDSPECVAGLAQKKRFGSMPLYLAPTPTPPQSDQPGGEE